MGDILPSPSLFHLREYSLSRRANPPPFQIVLSPPLLLRYVLAPLFHNLLVDSDHLLFFSFALIKGDICSGGQKSDPPFSSAFPCTLFLGYSA